MRWLAALLICALWACVLWIGNARAHDPYTQWKDNWGYSCCPGHGAPPMGGPPECRPIRAYVDDDHWVVILEDGRRVAVPPDAVLRIPSPDGRSHYCGKRGPMGALPYCFSPGEIRG